jgi:hypothetical protein
VLAGLAVLVLMTVFAGLVALLSRDQGREAPSAAQPVAVPRPADSGQGGRPSGRAAPTAEPPATRDPIVFGKAFAKALWSYDTRRTSRSQHLAGLQAWVTKEDKVADRASVTAQVPSPVLWGRMRQNEQYATATVAEAHIPASFSAALNTDPGAITQVYVYAVTVTGKQSISWNGVEAGGAEPRAVTLAVQCRPRQACALAGVLPNVAP